MIKVMLVDDEIAIREGIRNSFPWEESGYTLVGEAPDGEIALPIIRDENPDILITDIRMPFMDGMELCRQVRQRMPWIAIVILSGYDDFNYARQAISLGVQEYLLKPITSKELREVLDRISDRLRAERLERESADKIRRRLTSGSRFVNDRLLSSLFEEDISEGKAHQLSEQLRSVGINVSAGCYAVLDISFDGGGDNATAMDVLYSLAERRGGGVMVSSMKHGARVLVMGDAEPDTEERSYAFADSAVKGLENAGVSGVLVTVGEMCSKLAEVGSSMRTARHIRHVMRRGESEMPMKIVGIREMEDRPRKVHMQDFRPLRDRLQYTAPEDFEKVFEEYLSSLMETDAHAAVTLDYLRVEALMTAAAIVRDAGGQPDSVLPILRYEQEQLSGREGEDLALVRELLLCALRYRELHSPIHGNSSISKARYYLSQHYADPNLMLQDVAGEVCMSNSRFSTVFAQETGYTFTEYLAMLRISKAQELLKATTLRSSQIARAVGYTDPHYFSYLFKKRTGMTPSEYRSGEKSSDTHINEE